MNNTVSYRVYYEDTDGAGVVYNANYLKYAERARTELLREHNINQSDLAKNDNILFVVRHATLDLIKPAKLDDLLDIKTSITHCSGAKTTWQQNIYCNNTLLVSIITIVVCINTDFRPTRIPKEIKLLLNKTT